MSCGFFQSTLVTDMKDGIEDIIRIYSPSVVHILSSSETRFKMNGVLIREHTVDMDSPDDVKRELFRIAKLETEISKDYRVNFDTTSSSTVFKEACDYIAPIFEGMRISELVEGDIEFLELTPTNISLTNVQYLKALNSIRGMKATGGRTVKDQEALFNLLVYRGLIEDRKSSKASYLSRHVTAPLKDIGWITNKGNSGTKYMASELGKQILYIFDCEIDEFDVYKERRERGYPETAESLKYLADEVYEEELTSDGDYEKAYPMYEKAARKGSADAYERLASRYMESDDPEDIRKGLELLIMSAEKGSGDGCMMLGNYYLNGEYVQQDTEKGVYYLEKGALNGDWGCATDLARYYDKEGKRFLAAKWYTKLLDIDVHYIDFVPEDYYEEDFFRKALDKYKILAEGCDECATFNLAQMYIRGHIVKKDLDIAMHLLKKLKDDHFAYLAIADLYENEEYSGYDPRKAREYRAMTDGLYEQLQEDRKRIDVDLGDSFIVAPDGSLRPRKEE